MAYVASSPVIFLIPLSFVPSPPLFQMRSRLLIDGITVYYIPWPVLFHRKTATHPVSHELFRGAAGVLSSTAPNATAASPTPATTSTTEEVCSPPEWAELPRKRRDLVKFTVGVHKSKLLGRVVFRRPAGDQASASRELNRGTSGDRGAGGRSGTEESPEIACSEERTWNIGGGGRGCEHKRWHDDFDEKEAFKQGDGSL